MARNSGGNDCEQIARIPAAWETYDTTGDGTAIAAYLAEDIVPMPPGAPAMTGKTAVLKSGADAGDYDIDRTSEALIVSDDLAVDRITVTGTPQGESRGVADEVSLKGVDIYRRDGTGAWECILAIWNNQG